MITPHPVLSLREMLIQRHAFEQRENQAAGNVQTAFAAGMHELGREYDVCVIGAGLPGESLKGRPLQLHVRPRQPSVSSPPFNIRVSGVVTTSDSITGSEGLAFRPTSVDISRSTQCRPAAEFQEESDSAEDVIAHVHRILSLLRHPGHFSISLQA